MEGIDRNLYHFQLNFPFLHSFLSFSTSHVLLSDRFSNRHICSFLIFEVIPSTFSIIFNSLVAGIPVFNEGISVNSCLFSNDICWNFLRYMIEFWDWVNSIIRYPLSIFLPSFSCVNWKIPVQPWNLLVLGKFLHQLIVCLGLKILVECWFVIN